MAILKHHGAIDGVTGSCHELIFKNGESLLVDCGLFQGEESKFIKDKQIPFKISKIKALIITHVHIDHIGRLPYLLAEGYKGPIYCTEASAKLLPLILEDALKIGFHFHPSQIKRIIDAIKTKIIPISYKKWTTLHLSPPENIKSRFQQAGHILGSAYVEIDYFETSESKRIVFSGDLGASYTPLLPSPKSPRRADTLVIESTYGDKNHQGRKDRVKNLKKLLLRCFENRGLVLIPAFSIGRTQELLYEIESILHQMKHKKEKNFKWDYLDIVLDSPLAEKFTHSYREMKHLWDFEAKQKLKQHRHPLNFDQLVKIKSHREHMSAVKSMSQCDRPAIVISASGMCNGGRILNWIKANIENPIADILLAGYQAKGTIGHQLQNPKTKKIELDGKMYFCRAKVHSFSAYSAHADQNDLLRFIEKIDAPPEKVILVHGINSARKALKTKISLCQKVKKVLIPHKIKAQQGYQI